MATITLTGNMMFGGVFNDTRKAFSDAKKSSSNLAKALNSFKSQINAVCAVSDVSTSVEKNNNSIQRESDKSTALSTAYDKLETFLSDVINVDKNVSEKIKELKEDFYNKYKYLKPDCEKSFWERVGDFFNNIWKGICAFGNAVKNFVISSVAWVSKNWQKLVSLYIVYVIVEVAIALIVVGALVPELWPFLVAALIGGAVGILGQFISDVIAWAATGFKEWSGTWQSYIGAGLGGMLSGLLIYSRLDPNLSAAIGNGLSTLFSENLENITGGEERSHTQIIFDTLFDMSLTFVVGKLTDTIKGTIVGNLSKNSVWRKILNNNVSLETVLTNLKNSWINFTSKDVLSGIVQGFLGDLPGNIIQSVIKSQDVIKSPQENFSKFICDRYKKIKTIISDAKIYIRIVYFPFYHTSEMFSSYTFKDKKDLTGDCKMKMQK